MIAASAVVAGVEAVRRLDHPVGIGHLGWVAAAGVLDIDPATSLDAAHELAHRAEHQLTRGVPGLASATVHAHPAHH